MMHILLYVAYDEAVECDSVLMLQNVAETRCDEAAQSDIILKLQNVTDECQV